MFVYATIIVVVGQLAWLAGLKNAGFIEINLAILFAYLILQETPTQAQYLGGSLLLLGAILSFIDNLQTTKRAKLSAVADPSQIMDADVGFRGI